MAPKARDLKDEISRAQQLGQKLEELVVNAGKITIKTDGSPLPIGFWSLICDYQKGLLNLLHWEFHAAAFALWRSIIEATVRAHLSLILPPDELAIDAITLVPVFEQCVLSRVTHHQFRDVGFEQIV